MGEDINVSILNVVVYSMECEWAIYILGRLRKGMDEDVSISILNVVVYSMECEWVISILGILSKGMGEDVSLVFIKVALKVYISYHPFYAHIIMHLLCGVDIYYITKDPVLSNYIFTIYTHIQYLL